MVSLGLHAVFMGTSLLAVLNANGVSGDVGIPSASGKAIDQSNILGPHMWALSVDGCRVGKPGNLVVTPMPGSSQHGGEILDTQKTGPQLCEWLSMMEKAHASMTVAWDEEHTRRKSEVSKWRIFKRFSMWRQSFPKLEIQVRIMYLDLWNNDRFGHPMPWITAQFMYKCPKPDVGYGLMDHLCGSVFAEGNDPRIATNVHLLLQPRAGYNQPLTLDPSKWQYFSGLIMGLRSARSEEEKRRDDGFAWGTALYGRATSFMTLSGKVDDYWMNHGYCYYKPLLRVEWQFLRETVCERMHRDANEGALSALKAAKFESVRLHLSGVDLFSYSRPVLWGSLDEGVLSFNVGSAILRLEVDTNPQNAPDFERAKSTIQNVRAANIAIDVVNSLLSMKDKRQDGDRWGNRQHYRRP